MECWVKVTKIFDSTKFDQWKGIFSLRLGVLAR
jgi:hypothetical protein